MKKLTASIIAGALMISVMGINAFAAETATPSIKVYGNSVATAKDNTVNLNVRMSNFAGVAGMDLTIEGKGVTLGAPASSDIALVENSNYKLEGNKLHIVELNAEKTRTLNIKIPATVSGYEAGKITVTSSKLAADGTKLLNEKTEYSVDNANGSVAVVPENKKTTTDLQDNDTTFYPYNSVYTGEELTNGTRLEKDVYGKFTIPSGATATYKAFAKPTNNILTFGTSRNTIAKDGENNLQFGTYTNKNGVTNGTMLILGSWVNYIDYQIKENGLTAEEVLQEMYKANPVKNKDYAKLYYKNAEGKDKAVLVYKKGRSTFAWKMDDNSAMEYALRVYDSGKYTCTAVGYYVDGENVVFSSQLKSNIFTK